MADAVKTTKTKAIIAAITAACGVLTALGTALADSALSQQDIITVGGVLLSGVLAVVGVYYAPNLTKEGDPTQEAPSLQAPEGPAPGAIPSTYRPAVEPVLDTNPAMEPEV